MHAGYPWLPEPQQQALTTAAASEAAQAAAQSPNPRAIGHASIALPATPATSPANSTAAAVHKATASTGAKDHRPAPATGTVAGAGGAMVGALGMNTPYTPPLAGRGSESGVSTSQPSSLSAADRLLPAHPKAATTSKKHNGAVLPLPNAQVTTWIIVSVAETACQVIIQ